MALTDNLELVGVLFLSVVSCDISAIGGAIDKLDKQMRFLIQSIEGKVGMAPKNIDIILPKMDVPLKNCKGGNSTQSPVFFQLTGHFPRNLLLRIYFAGSVDQVISGLRSDCERSRLQTQTYGWAIIAGGALDIAAEQIGKNIDDVLTMPAVTYSYGYYAGYAMGFAGPYLLPTYIGSCSYDCSSTDFNTIVNKYNFRNGISGQNIGASKIQSFGIDAKQALR